MSLLDIFRLPVGIPSVTLSRYGWYAFDKGDGQTVWQ